MYVITSPSISVLTCISLIMGDIERVFMCQELILNFFPDTLLNFVFRITIKDVTFLRLYFANILKQDTA